MSIVGDWDVSIGTPVGSLQVVYSFARDDGALTGRATGKHETLPCTNIDVTEETTGQRVRWRQSVTKPMKLTLDFDILVVGDRLTGHSRAGRLPRSTVTGTRR